MKGWQIKKLGDVCQRVTVGHVGITAPHYRDTGVLFLRTQNVGEHGLDLSEVKYITPEFHSSLKKSEVQAGDILMQRVITKEVRCALIPNDLGIANCANVVLVRPSGLLAPEFLIHYINSPQAQKHLLERKVGSAQLVVNTTVIQNWPIPVPPLAEQQRIVGVLDEAMAGIATARAHAETNLQNARALFESHLHAVFTQRGPGWVDRKLSSICREITVGYVGPMAKEYTESGVTFLRSQNIRPFRVSLENALFISREFDTKIAKSRLRPGDVAVVRTGYPGTAAVIPESLPESNCADLVIVRPGNEIEPQYLAAFFNSAYGKEHVAGKVVGAAQKHFNVGAAKETMLHLPPLSEQRAMIAKFDALSAETQRLAALYERKLVALEELKKSLLHQAFAGEL